MDSDRPESARNTPGGEADRGEQFVLLMSKHERQINACILALVPNWSDAEDIAQETKLLMWRQFDKFDQSGDFGAWARTIARNVVRTCHRKLAGKPHVFGQKFLDAVEKQVEQREGTADLRHVLLAECLAELKDSSRDFIKLCYGGIQTIAATAAKLGRSSESVYKQLERIRRTLRDCIQRKLRQEEESS